MLFYIQKFKKALKCVQRRNKERLNILKTENIIIKILEMNMFNS